MVDVLGIINDYCENQKYHTIIVANQEKITQQKEDNPILNEVKFPSKSENPKYLKMIFHLLQSVITLMKRKLSYHIKK